MKGFQVENDTEEVTKEQLRGPKNTKKLHVLCCHLLLAFIVLQQAF